MIAQFSVRLPRGEYRIKPAGASTTPRDILEGSAYRTGGHCEFSTLTVP